MVRRLDGLDAGARTRWSAWRDCLWHLSDGLPSSMGDVLGAREWSESPRCSLASRAGMAGAPWCCPVPPVALVPFNNRYAAKTDLEPMPAHYGSRPSSTIQCACQKAAARRRSRLVAEVCTAKTRVATLTVDAGPMPIELTPMCGPAAARVMVVKTSFAVSPRREHRHLRASPLDAHRWKRFESDSRR